jgi:SAM-dependent methyltransferase
MSLAEEYRRQYAWRPWAAILAELPPLAGRTVLDLGCGVGDLAAELAARGARVIGVDGNEELLRAARDRRIEGAEFRTGDLRGFDPGSVADGIWSSFAAAFFVDLATVLESWRRHVAPAGWIALTEIDDLFGHEPIGPESRALLDAYADDALVAGRYDFRMGRKLAGHLRAAGFVVERELVLEDRELAFDGPAPPAVLGAWRDRLDRMALLHAFCGSRFPAVRDELLACLARPEHRAQARVHACFARSRSPRGGDG